MNAVSCRSEKYKDPSSENDAATPKIALLARFPELLVVSETHA